MKPNEKHLEFVQNNITRMNQCSFRMKGWALTLISALITVFITTMSDVISINKLFFYFAIVITLFFWCLDSLYLSKERKFIGVYNDLIGINDENTVERKKIREYEMPINEYKGWKYSIFRAALLPSEILFYGGIIVGLIIFYNII